MAFATGFARSLLLAGLAANVPVAGARAAGFQLREASPDAVGDAFAGTAAKAYDAGTAWSNPAGMVRIDLSGATAEVDSALNLIVPQIRFQGQNFVGSTATLGSNGGDAGSPAVTAGFEGVWNYSDDLRFGIAAATPFGLRSSYESDFVGRYQALVSALTDYEVFPSAAYAITPRLSIGGGPVIDYYHIRLTSAINTGPSSVVTGDPVANLQGDAISAGYHLGALYQFSDSFRVGIDYRSRIGVSVSGKQGIYVPTLIQVGSPAAAAQLAAGDANITTQTTVPDVLTLGFYYDVTPEWAVMGTAQWTHWSLLQQATIVAANGGVQRLDFGYQNTWFGSIGVNYRPAWERGLVLQSGVGFDEGLSTDATRSPRLPDSNHIPFSVGVAYDIIPNVLTAQFAYLHEFTVGSSTSDYSSGPTAGTLIGKYATSADVIAVGAKFRF